MDSAEEDLKRSGVNNCKPWMQTEWSREASLGQSRLESGCSINMIMMMVVVVVVVVSGQSVCQWYSCTLCCYNTLTG